MYLPLIGFTITAIVAIVGWIVAHNLNSKRDRDIKNVK